MALHATGRSGRGPLATAALGAVLAASVLVVAGCGGGGSAAPQAAELPASLPRPLAEEVTVTLAVPPDEPEATHAAAMYDWLRQATGVSLQPVPLALGRGFVGILELGEMARAGTLPDLIPESMIPGDPEIRRDLFLNVLEHPGLTPAFQALLRSDDLYRSGIAGRMTGANELTALGTYDQGRAPFLGGLLYREDLFSRWRLRHETWDELAASLKALKAQFPGSYPFRASQEEVLYELPSWFGTGFDRRLAAYFHPVTEEWRLGPLEDRFIEYVGLVRDLHQAGLLPVEDLLSRSGDVRRAVLQAMAADTVFATPWRDRSGPLLAGPQPYGELTSEGEWDGEGAWWAPMPLPASSTGERGWVSARPWQPISAGWLVTKSSPRAGEALMVLDTLLGEPAAEWAGSVAAGAESVATLLPVWGRLPSVEPADPAARYYHRRDVATYVATGAIFTAPWPLLDEKNTEIALQMAGAVDRVVSSWVMRVITGEAPLEPEAMREEVLRLGGERLMDALAKGELMRELP